MCVYRKNPENILFVKLVNFQQNKKKTRQIGNFSRKIAKLPSFPKFFSPKSLIVELQFDDQFDQKSPNWGKKHYNI